MRQLMTWLVGAIGVALLGFACHLGFEARDFAANAVLVSGEIVGVKESGGTGSGFSFHPIVRFRSRDGESITFVAEGQMGADYAVGQKVRVAHRVGQPHDAHLRSDSPWPTVLYLIGLGAVLLFPAIHEVFSALRASPAVTVERSLSPRAIRVRRWAGWVVGCGAVALLAAAVADNHLREREVRAKRRACTRDADCPDTFCDRQFCAPNMGETPHFGARCGASRAATAGETRADAASCGAFVCVAERCRSCVNSDECQPGSEWSQLCLGPYWGLSLCADHPGEMSP